jgi:hypothetical protein
MEQFTHNLFMVHCNSRPVVPAGGHAMQSTIQEVLSQPPIAEGLIVVAFVAVLVALRRALGAGPQRRSS